MANSVSVQQSMRLNCVIDSDATSLTGTPLSVFCSRQLAVADFQFNCSAVSAVADGSILIESVTSGGVATTIGTVLATGAITANRQRPTVVTLTPGTTNGLASGATVARGNTLRIRSFATAGADNGSPVRATGTVVVMPGNRYAAGAGTYFPNNGSTGAGGSSTTSI
jgi:hypothetical protein